MTLGAGAPLGWLALQLAGGSHAAITWALAIQAEITANAQLYLYLSIGTSSVFGAFGALMGTLLGRLEVANQRLEALSVTDGLTGLRNTRYFHQRLAEEAHRADREGSPLVVVMMDLDHFKRVNDEHGHAVGDLALAHAARILASCARASDVACRVGGEEFALICPRTSLADGGAIAARVREQLEQGPLRSPDGTIHLTGSFGVAERAPGEVASLLRAADEAMYAAKNRGRNRVELHRAATALTSHARSA